MTYYHAFPINNLTLGPILDISQTCFSFLGVTLMIFLSYFVFPLKKIFQNKTKQKQNHWFSYLKVPSFNIIGFIYFPSKYLYEHFYVSFNMLCFLKQNLTFLLNL